MGALAVEHLPAGGDDWDRLVHLWTEMDWPEGWFDFDLDTSAFPTA